MITLGQKVLTPALLFAVLNPGLIVTLPNKLIGRASPTMTAVAYALMYLFVYNLISTQLMGLVLTPTDLIVTASLFFLLSPRNGTPLKMDALLIRTIIFIGVFAFLRKQFPQFY